MSKKLVLFDLDGTLLNTIEDLAAACNHALHEVGLGEHPVADYPRYVGNGIYNLMRRALAGLGVQADLIEPTMLQMVTPFKAYYSAHGTEHTKPYPGIPELLEELQRKGLKLAVASNKYQQATESMVSRLLPGIRFVAVLGQREGMPIKPDPKVVYEILEKAGVTADETLYVGDSDVDIRTAQVAGVEMAAVTWGFQNEEQLLALQPQHIVHTPTEIEKLL